jgi:hypothetical protein
MDVSTSNAEASPDDQAKASNEDTMVATSLKPMSLPEDILRMVFTELMSKPAIHFATAYARKTPKGFTLSLSPWKNGDLESGYLATNTLSQTCKVARHVSDHASLEPSVIQYDTGCAKVDASTDLLCLVLPKQWARRVPAADSLPDEPIKLDDGDLTTRLGNIRRMGLLVTTEMWHGLLANWFVPYDVRMTPRDEEFYRDVDGRLDRYSLSTLMSLSSSLEEFYLVLGDVTADDWNRSYGRKCKASLRYRGPGFLLTRTTLTTESGSPVKFHDRNGSYVIPPFELPVPMAVMDNVWSSSNEIGTPYPYLSGTPNLDLDPMFESRVDAQIHLIERVAFLEALLDPALFELPLEKRKKVKTHVLVRKPASAGHLKTRSPLHEFQPYNELVRVERFDNTSGPPGPEDPEADWVRQALDRVWSDSWYRNMEDFAEWEAEYGEDDEWEAEESSPSPTSASDGSE